MKNNLIILVGLFFSMFVNTYGQSDSIKITDVFVSKIAEITSSNPSPTNDSIIYKVIFKISSLQNLNKIFVLVGNAKDELQFRNMTLNKQQTNSQYALVLNGVLFKIWVDRGYCIFKLMKSITSDKWITIYGQDVNGVNGSRQYLKF